MNSNSSKELDILLSLPNNHFKDLDNTFGTLTLSNQATLHKTGWHHAFALDLSYFLHSVWFTSFGGRNYNIPCCLMQQETETWILLTKECKTNYNNIADLYSYFTKGNELVFIWVF